MDTSQYRSPLANQGRIFSKVLAVEVIVAVLLTLVVVLSLFCGVSTYSVSQAVSDPDVRSILLNLRLPRVLCGMLVGAGLSVVGASYQSIFKNYLASPFTLGVSSGAALVASAALVLGLSTSRYGVDVGLFALVGAVVSILIIVAIHRRQRVRDPHSLLLVGIVFSFFCSSLMTLIQYMADYSQLFQVTRWMMGGIPVAGWNDIMIGAICVGVTVVWTWRNSRGLDLMLFGEELAKVKGVDTTKLAHSTFILTSFVVGWVVAQCGVIGFVGIIVPAVARLLVGFSHRNLLPVSLLVGALLVVGCDLVGRMIIAPFEIPAGVFTALVGGPAFVFLLLRPQRR